jgi:peptidoglycan glycosyltransferase
MELTSRACLLLLLLPLGYLTWFEVMAAPALAASPDNPRNQEDLRLRGGFVDRNGEWLGRTEKVLDAIRRVYPAGRLTGHPIGYWHRRYGKAGLELQEDARLKGPGVPTNPLMAIRNIEGYSVAGPDAVLGLDVRLQRVAAEALGDRRGAVVALDVDTGDILVSLSSPEFDPNHLESSWARLNVDPASPLIDRVSDGYYPPGSVFKLLTLAAGLESGTVRPDDTYFCPGYLDVDGYRLHCNQGEAHGRVTVARALAESCNVTFAQMALKEGPDVFSDMLQRLLPEAHLKKPSTRTELAQEGFGQGALGVAPLDVARLVGVVARGGRSIDPRLVTAWRGLDTEEVPEVESRQLLKPETAASITRMMEGVVESGTGTAARIPGVRVAGKTGTAENPHGAPHAWFAAFAPADHPRVVVVALVENGGYGGDVAAPIVRQVLQAALIK